MEQWLRSSSVTSSTLGRCLICDSWKVWLKCKRAYHSSDQVTRCSLILSSIQGLRFRDLGNWANCHGFVWGDTGLIFCVLTLFIFLQPFGWNSVEGLLESSSLLFWCQLIIPLWVLVSSPVDPYAQSLIALELFSMPVFVSVWLDTLTFGLLPL